MSERIAVMSHGRVEQCATPVALYREPATTVVAEFIGPGSFFDPQHVQEKLSFRPENAVL